MKVLGKKFKKVHGVKKFFYFLSCIVYLATFGYFVYNLLHLKGIETVLRTIVIIFFGIWFLVYVFLGLISILAKKNKTFIILTIVTILFSPVFGIASHYINKVYGALETINHNVITYTTNLIALKDTNFNSSSIMGMIETEEDIEGNQLAKKLIKKEKLENEVKYYEDYHSMILDLYEGNIDACFVSGNYAITFENEKFEEDSEDEVPLADRVKVIYEYSEDRENEDNTLLSSSNTKKITEPFTMLVMGVDSEDDGLKANQAFNGDTLIMITFNPKTLTATMFSLPRDLYVPIACNGNRYAKINSSAAYGSTCVINTIKNLTGIDIDYYLKMNFKGVVDLVDALGGVTVDVEEPDFKNNFGIDCGGKVCEQNSDRAFGKSTVYIDTGVQTLNGEQALAYARCRHLYAMSDIARNQHQQDIIVAMAQKMKTLRSITDFENILDAVSKNIETNMTPEQILSFYNVGKGILTNSNSEALSIKKTYLAYYNITVWRGYNASSLGYYQASLDAITDLMKVNLGLKEEKVIKTFEIYYDEDYETPLVGMGLTGGEKLDTLPNFIGFDKDYVDNWCSSHSLNCYFEGTDSDLEYGQIIEQSAMENELLKSLSSVTFTYSNNRSSTISESNETTSESNTTIINNSDDEVVLPKFKALDDANRWCNKHKDSITCNFIEDKKSNKSYSTITKQDPISGTNLSKITSIDIWFSTGKVQGESDNEVENKTDENGTGNNGSSGTGTGIDSQKQDDENNPIINGITDPNKDDEDD